MSRRTVIVTLGVLLAVPHVVCSQEGLTSTTWFVEEARKRGLNYDHDSGQEGDLLLPEGVTGGGALFDMDGDGDLDAYFIQAGSLTGGEREGNRLFRNRGDGTFEDVTAGSGADDHGYGAGVAVGDYDNDGDPDVYVTNLGPDVLLRNEGNGRFKDVTGEASLGQDGWGASAAFLDYDRDGDLDLFVVNYLEWSLATEIECFDSRGRRDYCGPNNYDSPTPDKLYRNEGGGRFTDVSEASGLTLAFGNGLGIVPADFNDDGWPDVFVANDGMLDQLWINRGDGRFSDEAVLWGSAVDLNGVAKAGMGVSAEDIDADGDLDLLVCNLTAETDSMYLNEGSYFRDHTAAAGIAPVSRPFTRFGVGWVDFDNDGLFDLYEVSGRISMEAEPLSDDPLAEPNLLFRGIGGARFAEVEPRGGTAELLVATSRAAIFGDVDGDGGVDVLVVNKDGPAHLLMNRVPERGNWIRLRAVNLHGSDALGARLEVDVDGQVRVREVRAASSYLASNDPRVHLGLGGSKRVERVQVRWPGGAKECYGPFDAGRDVTLRQGAGRACT